MFFPFQYSVNVLPSIYFPRSRGAGRKGLQHVCPWNAIHSPTNGGTVSPLFSGAWINTLNHFLIKKKKCGITKRHFHPSFMQNLLLLSPTSPRRFPPSLRRSGSGRRREQVTGTPRTRGGPRSGAASSGCVGRSSAGTPWSKRSAETGHNTCRTDGHTNVGWCTEAMKAKQLSDVSYPGTSLLSGMCLFFLALP